MHSIKLVDVVAVCFERLWYFTGDVLLLTAAAWLLVFTAQMALRAGLTCLNHTRVAGDFAFLPLCSRVGAVVRYMPFK
jgi:hypothetical protein